MSPHFHARSSGACQPHSVIIRGEQGRATSRLGRPLPPSKSSTTREFAALFARQLLHLGLPAATPEAHCRWVFSFGH